jgi:hypothetical protein
MQPTRQQLAAMSRIKQSQDLQAFLEYLENNLESLKDDLTCMINMDDLKTTQGRCQALQDIIERIDTSTDVIRKQQ